MDTPDQRNLEATAILDFESGELAALARELKAAHPGDRDFLRAAHEEIARRVVPIYTIDERQPASRTLRKAKGSCSQRTAVLEALARAVGIPTRVRALWVAGRFWYPRFSPAFSLFIPRRVLLLWPEFWVDGAWLGLEEIHSTLGELAAQAPEAFTNDGESLFEALSHVPIDFGGRTCPSCGAKYDLSGFVRADGGTFASRDGALALHKLFQRTFRGRIFEMIFGGHKSC